MTKRRNFPDPELTENQSGKDHVGRILVNGEWQESLPIRDRGLQYGDGLFETLLYHDQSMPLMERHLARLRLGCERLRIPFRQREIVSGLQKMQAALQEAPPGPDRSVIKLIVTRGCGGFGYFPPPSEEINPTIIVQSMPLHPHRHDDGVELVLCPAALGENKHLAGIKHLNRLEYVLAAMRAGYSDGQTQPLLLNQHDHIIETLHHNLFILKSGDLLTPELHNCGVAGILRDLIIESVAPELGLNVKECFMKASMLSDADEVFICNSVRGVWSVTKAGGISWRAGPVTRAIQHWLAINLRNAYV